MALKPPPYQDPQSDWVDIPNPYASYSTTPQPSQESDWEDIPEPPKYDFMAEAQKGAFAPKPSFFDKIGPSIRAGFIEGPPAIDVMGNIARSNAASSNKPMEFPPAPDIAPGGDYPSTVGEVTRASLYPASLVDTAWNKVVKPLTTPQNIAIAGMIAMQPELAPYAGAIFAGAGAAELPAQVRQAYDSYQKEGLWNPNTLERIGDIGLNVGMTSGITYGAARHQAGKIPVLDRNKPTPLPRDVMNFEVSPERPMPQGELSTTIPKGPEPIKPPDERVIAKTPDGKEFAGTVVAHTEKGVIVMPDGGNAMMIVPAELLSPEKTISGPKTLDAIREGTGLLNRRVMDSSGNIDVSKIGRGQLPAEPGMKLPPTEETMRLDAEDAAQEVRAQKIIDALKREREAGVGQVPGLAGIGDQMAPKEGAVPGMFDTAPKTPIEPPPITKPKVFIIKAEKVVANPEIVQKAIDQGYTVLGLNERGDYRLTPPKGDVANADIIQFPPRGKMPMGDRLDLLLGAKEKGQFEDVEKFTKEIKDAIERETDPQRVTDNYSALEDSWHLSRQSFDNNQMMLQDLVKVAYEKLINTENAPPLPRSPDLSPERIKVLIDRIRERAQELEQNTEANKLAQERRAKFELIQGGKDKGDVAEAFRWQEPGDEVWSTVRAEDIDIINRLGEFSVDELGYDPLSIKAYAELLRTREAGGEIRPDLETQVNNDFARRQLIYSYGDDLVGAVAALKEVDQRLGLRGGDYLDEIKEAYKTRSTDYETAMLDLSHGEEGRIKHSEREYTDAEKRNFVSIKGNLKEHIDFIMKQIEDIKKRSGGIIPRAVKNVELLANFDKLVPSEGRKFFVLDRDGKFSSAEIQEMYDSPVLNQWHGIIENLTTRLAELFGHLMKGPIKSIGFVFDDTVHGLNVMNSPENAGREFVIMINPHTILKDGVTPQGAAGLLWQTIVHEFAHNITREEGAVMVNWIYDINQRIPSREVISAQRLIEDAIGERGGNQQRFNSEAQSILQFGDEGSGRPGTQRLNFGNEARSEVSGPRDQKNKPNANSQTREGILPGHQIGRKITLKKGIAKPGDVKSLIEAGFEYTGQDAKDNMVFERKRPTGQAPILETEVGNIRPTRAAAKQQGIGHTQLGPNVDVRHASNLEEAWNLPRGLLAAGDLSGSFRQGFAFIGTKPWREAFMKQMQSVRGENYFDAVQNDIASRPMFRKRIGKNGKLLPSFADDAGLKLTDLTTNVQGREEMIPSTWAESGEMFNKGIMRGPIGEKLQAAYKFGPGRFIRASNRAFVAFNNWLRAGEFEQMVKSDGGVFNPDGTVDMVRARAIADFVNTYTGRASLPSKLEKHASLFNNVIFAPRYAVSRIKMMTNILNPWFYANNPKSVRIAALQSTLRMAVFGSAVLGLGKIAGELTGYPVSVSVDPNNSDFLKLKVRNTRVDPFFGMQQYAVLAHRLISGHVTSSTSGKKFDLNNPRNPFQPTRFSLLEDFGRQRTHPDIGFAWSLLDNGKEMNGQKMKFDTWNPAHNALAQRFIPIVLQDLYELAEQDPELLPILGPAAVTGFGVQTYGGPNKQQGR